MSNLFSDVKTGVGVVASDDLGGCCGKRLEMSLNEAEELLIELSEKSIEERAKSDFTKEVIYSLDLDSFIGKFTRTISVSFDRDFVKTMMLKYPQYNLENFLYSEIIYAPNCDSRRTLLN